MRFFDHVERIDEYRMARKVLIADVSGRRVRRNAYGWCEDGHGQQRDEGGGCVTMSER